MSQARDANRSANSQIIHLLQLAISEITQGVDNKTSEMSGQKLDADVDSRLVALEMAVNDIEKELLKLQKKLGDQA